MTVIARPQCGGKNCVGPRGYGVLRCGNCHNTPPWIAHATPETLEAEIAASVPVLVAVPTQKLRAWLDCQLTPTSNA